MLTNKDIRVADGNIVINGDKYPLDGQSPETIMGIVKDNSDTTPTENSTAPITSGGVYTALGTKQDTLTFDNVPTENSDNPVKSGGVYGSIASILSELSFVLFNPDLYPSWDNFPDFAFGYGYQAQTNNPGSNGFCLCFGSSSVKIQIFFAVTQSMQKYRTYMSGAWTNWKEF